MVCNPAHGDDGEGLKCDRNRIDIQATPCDINISCEHKVGDTYLKLALSIQSQPSLTTQRASSTSGEAGVVAVLHGCVLSGRR